MACNDALCIERLFNAADDKAPMMALNGQVIAAHILKVATLYGVKTLPSDEITMAIIGVLRGPKYRTLTLDEYALAFLLNAEGTYESYIEHFNDYGIDYVCRILNAYIHYKNDQVIRLRKTKMLQQPVETPPTPQEIEAIMERTVHELYDVWKNGGITVGWGAVYDFLESKGRLHAQHTPERMARIKEKAETACAQQKNIRTHDTMKQIVKDAPFESKTFDAMLHRLMVIDYFIMMNG